MKNCFKMEDNMISIVMATYNGINFIEEQMESLQNQTLAADEIIISDDFSTDGTYEFIVDYIRLHNLEKWTVCRNENNLGYSRNFSNVLKKASGEIIFLADQDDIWHEDKVKQMYSIMESNKQIQLLASNPHPFYEGYKPQKVNYEKFHGSLIKINRLAAWVKPARPGCTMCIRKNLLEYYDEIWFDGYPHDCLLWGLAVLRGTAYLFNKDTIEFRRHDNNASSRMDRTSSNRINRMNRERAIIKNMLDSNFLSKKEVEFISRQYEVYCKRIDLLSKKSVIGIVKMIVFLNYYSRKRLWLTDLYYVLK